MARKVTRKRKVVAEEEDDEDAIVPVDVEQVPASAASRHAIPIRHRIERRQVAELVLHPKNPRVLDEKSKGGLRRSLEQFGLVQPIIVSEKTGYVLGGNQKVPLLRDAGVTETDVVLMADLTEDEELALLVALNNQAITGQFTHGVTDLLADIEAERPDLFDSLLLFKVRDVIEEMTTGAAEEVASTRGSAETADELAVAPQPYESYNYLVLLSRNDIDWTAAKQFFETHGLLHSVKDGFTGPRKAYKVGMGRVIEMGVFLETLLKLTIAKSGEEGRREDERREQRREEERGTNAAV